MKTIHLLLAFGCALLALFHLMLAVKLSWHRKKSIYSALWGLFCLLYHISMVAQGHPSILSAIFLVVAIISMFLSMLYCGNESTRTVQLTICGLDVFFLWNAISQILDAAH